MQNYYRTAVFQKVSHLIDSNFSGAFVTRG